MPKYYKPFDYASKEPPKEQMIPASVAAKMIEQARIQGMQKVVEWIEDNKGYYTGDDTFTMLEFLWQQFLQDNNLEGKE